jgi:type IV pilus assembly protein PilC
MPVYSFKARDLSGKTASGTLEAASPDAVTQQLHKRGLVVLSISEGGAAKKAAAKGGPRRSKASKARPIKLKMMKGKKQYRPPGKIKLSSIILFANQLATMSEAGLPLLRALKSMGQEVDDKYFRPVIETVHDDIEDGDDFSQALSKHPKVFSNIFINMVKAGEASGQIDIILTQLASYLEKADTVRREVKGALTYPALMFALIIATFIGILYFIIPIFERVFASFNQELPAYTQMFINFSHGLQDNFLGVTGWVIGIFILFYMLIQTTSGRYAFDTIKLKMPIFGVLVTKNIMARFARTFSVLISSGVTVVDALRIVGDLTGNAVVRKSITDSIEEIRQGAGLAQSLGKHGVFPDMMIQMIATGEETGALDRMLSKTSEFYERQVDIVVKSLTTLIEPLMIVLMAGVVGSVVIAMFLPIFQLASGGLGGGI